MRYTVLTVVPRRPTRPKPGEDLATGIREIGCVRCVVGYDGKLKPCWQHKDDHTLWAESVEGEDEKILETPMVLGVQDVQQDEGLPAVGATPGTEEPMEVP